jgi:DNA polymerase-3 subunit epsilon
MPKNGKDILIKDSNFVVLDFETTGLSPKNSKVLEIGMVKIEKGEIVDTYSAFINPIMAVPYQITLLTGITQDDVKDAPIFEEIAYEILDFIGDSTLVAHNAPFDYSFLKAEFNFAGIDISHLQIICTLKIAKRILPHLKSKSLGALRKHYGLLHKNVHRALGDASVTAKIFLRMLEQLEEDFGIKNNEQLLRFQNIPSKSLRTTLIKKSLLNDLSAIPESPGVYLFIDKNGTVIYVGKAKSLKKRVRSYFLSTADKKAKKVVRMAKHIDFIETNTELTALLAETTFIKKYLPEINSLQKRYPQTYFVRVNKASPFPKLVSAGKFEPNSDDYYGPYTNRETATKMIDIANKAFKIRECSEKEFKKKQICYLAEIERCTAPCVNPDKTAYEIELNKVYDFLSGNNSEALEILLERMKKYSDELQFEKAAELRDTIQLLLNQIQKTSVLSEPINKAECLIVADDLSTFTFLSE